MLDSNSSLRLDGSNIAAFFKSRSWTVWRIIGIEGKTTENLFSYGTLQTEAVQLATFGRRLQGRPDVLIGYRLTTIPIEDKNIVSMTGTTHHRNVQFTGISSDIVEGTMFTVTKEELKEADAYEAADDFKRVVGQMGSGVKAWVYLNST
jgi:hypothetical protein